MNSDKDIPLLSSIYKSKHTGRASASTRKKGSITVEAAMAVPIFFFATLTLVLLLELLSVQTAVRSGLQEAGKKLAVQAVEVPAVIPSNLEHDVVNSIGAERLERSIVEGGSSGINCNQSYLSPFTGIGEIQASYQVRIPVPGFSIAPISYKETMRIKAWTGYEAGGFGEEDDQIVYVTDTGVVYHKNPHCTHLDLSIHAAASSELNSLRNESGGKYHACNSSNLRHRTLLSCILFVLLLVISEVLKKNITVAPFLLNFYPELKINLHVKLLLNLVTHHHMQRIGMLISLCSDQ